MKAVDKESHPRTSHFFFDVSLIDCILLVLFIFMPVPVLGLRSHLKRNNCRLFHKQMQLQAFLIAKARQATFKGDDRDVAWGFISNRGDRCYNSLQLLLATCLNMIAGP